MRKFNKGRKSHPDCGWLHPMGWCPGMTEKKKGSNDVWLVSLRGLFLQITSLCTLSCIACLLIFEKSRIPHNTVREMFTQDVSISLNHLNSFKLQLSDPNSQNVLERMKDADPILSSTEDVPEETSFSFSLALASISRDTYPEYPQCPTREECPHCQTKKSLLIHTASSNILTYFRNLK